MFENSSAQSNHQTIRLQIGTFHAVHWIDCRNRQGIRGNWETISHRLGQRKTIEIERAIEVTSIEKVGSILLKFRTIPCPVFTVPDDRSSHHDSSLDIYRIQNQRCIRQSRSSKEIGTPWFYFMQLRYMVMSRLILQSSHDTVWTRDRSRSVRSRSWVMCVSTARSTWTILDIKSTYKNQLLFDFVMDTLNLFQLLARSLHYFL